MRHVDVKPGTKKRAATLSPSTCACKEQEYAARLCIACWFDIMIECMLPCAYKSAPHTCQARETGKVGREKLGTCHIWNGEIWWGENLALILKHHCKIWCKINSQIVAEEQASNFCLLTGGRGHFGDA